MINLYIMDFFTLKKSHALETYVHQLFKPLTKYDNEITLNYIWINSPADKGFKKEVVKGMSHFYIPGNIAILNNNSKFDVKAAEWVTTDCHGVTFADGGVWIDNN